MLKRVAAGNAANKALVVLSFPFFAVIDRLVNFMGLSMGMFHEKTSLPSSEMNS